MDDELRILLARHARSEGNDDASQYIKKGDANISITNPLGWTQAFRLGQFLKNLYTADGLAEWPVVYLSEHLRAKETFAGIAYAMKGTFKDDPKLFVDPRLVEKFFGAASAMAFPHADFDPKVIATIQHMSKMVYAGDPFTAKHLFGESTKDIMVAVKSFIDGTLQRDINVEGKRDFLFVVHGAVIQAFIMNWVHVQIGDKAKIGNPGNCDAIEIRGRSKNWTITKIYDGEKFEAVRRNMLKGIRPYSFTDLPPVPDFLKNLTVS